MGGNGRVSTAVSALKQTGCLVLELESISPKNTAWEDWAHQRVHGCKHSNPKASNSLIAKLQFAN